MSNSPRPDERDLPPPSTVPVVGIGASAGGLEALEQFLDHMPPTSGAAFVIVTHLAPHLPSLMPELLAKRTAMRVVQAEDGSSLEPDHVYIIPPNATLTIDGAALRIESRSNPRANPIDAFFRSLARERAEFAVCIVLSGTGSDGSLGLRAIKEHGGMAMAQELASAKYDTMPRTAIAAGLVDWVLPVEEMPAKLVEYIEHIKSARGRPAPTAAEQLGSSAHGSPEQDALVQRLCVLIQRRTGHDFSRYKRTTLLRRVQRRMFVLRQPVLADYVEFLARTPTEADHLFQDLLIGVTQFFRDPDVFDALARDVIPRILAGRPPEDTVRIWAPGCATGEEAYSLAMLFAEALPSGVPGVKIFATDIDEEALDCARTGRYPETIVDQLTPARIERFFTQRQGGGWQVRAELRERCVFSVHNIITDPPFSRIDLISCRNLLIYLESDLQRSIFPLFHYALRPGGFLLLGPSENATTSPELFTALDTKHRIFQRKEVAVPVRFPLGGPRPLGRRVAEAPRGEPAVREPGLSRTLERMILANFAPAAVIVHAAGDIVFVSGQTRRYLELSPGVVGVNVLEMARKELRPHLHVLLHESSARREEQLIRGVSFESDGAACRVDIVVRPLYELGAGADLYAVVFHEVAAPAEPDSAGPGSAPESVEALVTALESELRSTRENLQTTVEELEVSNEELQSTNEELQSANEELQSANEELQTSKEELQSINEELQTVNAELSRKVQELDKANSDLQNLFASTEIATVFLAQDLTIKGFSPDATRLFRLIESDIGRPITDIVPAFVGGDLVADMQAVLRTSTPAHREVRASDGDVWYLQRIQPYRTAEGAPAGAVITFVDITDLRVARDAVHRLAAIVESSYDAILSLDADYTIRSWNHGAELMFGLGAREVIGQKVDGVLKLPASAPLAATFAAALRGERVHPLDVVLGGKDSAPVRVLISMSPILGAAGNQVVSWIARDITEQELNRVALREKDERLREINEADRRKTEFLAHLAHELRNPLAPIRNAVHVLRESPSDDPRARRSIEIVERQTAHMARLIDDLMDVSRITSGKIELRKERIELGALIGSVVEDHRNEATRRGISLVYTAANEPLWVQGDRTRLSQCVSNVLCNALKFTASAGHIAVALARTDERASVRVRDDGVGMDEETLGRAFEPFAQSHDARGLGGLGLGLSLVKALVELHGGTVSASSPGPGRGAEVSFELPLDRQGKTSAPGDPRHDATSADHPLRILVIEDNADAAETLRDLLEMWGHEVTTATSGAVGLKQAIAAPPDLVLCDINLGGGMNGYDVCRTLRAEPSTASARFVALTGHGQPGDRRRTQEAGFERHLVKPVAPDLLERIVGEMASARLQR